jgi:serine/threonine-protein kinase HipA
MTLNGKRDGFSKADIRAIGRTARLKQGRAENLLEEISAVVDRWPEFAARADVPGAVSRKIRNAHRLELAR